MSSYPTPGQLTTMSRFWSYLVILVLILIAVRSMPLEAQPNKTCLPMRSSGDAASMKEAWVKPGDSQPHKMSKRDTDTNDGQTSSSSSSDTVVVRVDPDSLVSEDPEPDCLLHHEYAQILGANIQGVNDSRVRSFVNRHNETRYYICLQCSVCPPGVVILLHCHRKRDTVCGYTCINPDHVYDPVQHICVPGLTPTNETEVLPTTHASVSITPMGGIFVKETGDNVDVDDQALPVTTMIRPIQVSLSSQITIITVGVVSLNALVILIAVVTLRKTKCRRRRYGPWGGVVNNALSSTSTTNSSRLWVPSAFRQNESHQVDCQRNDSPVAHQSSDIQVCAVPQSPGEVDSVGLLVGQSHHRAKDCNLNVFHEPRLEEVRESVPAIQEESPTLRPPIQVLRGKDSFWIVMLGQFGPEGGVLSCDDSDVILEIPPGAIPADHKDQLITARVSLRPDSIGPKMRDADSLWLTPLVEFESPGLERFNKNVRIRLPHSASLQPGWDFQVHYTDPTADTNKCISPTDHSECQQSSPLRDAPNSSEKWFGVEQKFPPRASVSGKRPRTPSVGASDVNFTVDEKYFNISTNHFSKYCCSGCHKERPLDMEVVVYWNHIKVEGHEQMDLNVYIVDRIKDSHMLVERNEKHSKQNLGYSPLMLRCKKKHKEAASLEICLKEDSMGNDWKWRLDTCNGCFPVKREIKISDLLRCCSPLMPYCESFSFRPKTSNGLEQLNIFQAVFGIKQLNWPDEDCKHIRVTVPLNKGSHENISEVNNNYEGNIITDKQIQRVVYQLPYKKLRPLYRQLIGEGADNGMDHIVVRHPNDAQEQIHEALVSWRRSRGHQATTEALEMALTAISEIQMAEDLQEDFKDHRLTITESSRHQTCQETAV